MLTTNKTWDLKLTPTDGPVTHVRGLSHEEAVNAIHAVMRGGPGVDLHAATRPTEELRQAA